MNVHVSDVIRNKYPNIEFRGKPREIQGRIVIEALNPTTEMKFWYSFEEDFFWFSNMDMPPYKIKQ